MSSTDGGNWETRWHPLLEQWVIIAANTKARPWSGKVSKNSTEDVPSHDPDCYLCPRVTRANGEVNPDYIGTRAMDNDFPSLAPAAPLPAVADKNANGNVLFKRAAAKGRCRVLCWSEKHHLTLPELSLDDMQRVVELWCDEHRELAADPMIQQVLIFENKGAEVGASNLHPHGQVYGYPFVTDTALRMRSAQAAYAARNAGASLLTDLLNDPQASANLVEKSVHCSVIVPFAARFSYETWVVPHRQVPYIDALEKEERDDLALVYQRQAKRYDVLFQRKSPNITLLHNAPCDDDKDNRFWHFHIAMQPPLRDSEKVKFLAGAEAGSNNIVNPLQPELAAEQLRQCIIE